MALPVPWHSGVIRSLFTRALGHFGHFVILLTSLFFVNIFILSPLLKNLFHFYVSMLKISNPPFFFFPKMALAPSHSRNYPDFSSSAYFCSLTHAHTYFILLFACLPKKGSSWNKILKSAHDTCTYMKPCTGLPLEVQRCKFATFKGIWNFYRTSTFYLCQVEMASLDFYILVASIKTPWSYSFIVYISIGFLLATLTLFSCVC